MLVPGAACPTASATRASTSAGAPSARIEPMSPAPATESYVSSSVVASPGVRETTSPVAPRSASPRITGMSPETTSLQSSVGHATTITSVGAASGGEGTAEHPASTQSASSVSATVSKRTVLGTIPHPPRASMWACVEPDQTARGQHPARASARAGRGVPARKYTEMRRERAQRRRDRPVGYNRDVTQRRAPRRTHQDPVDRTLHGPDVGLHDGVAAHRIRAHLGHGIRAPVSYTHLRAHETRHGLVCRLLLEKQ